MAMSLKPIADAHATFGAKLAHNRGLACARIVTSKHTHVNRKAVAFRTHRTKRVGSKYADLGELRDFSNAARNPFNKMPVDGNGSVIVAHHVANPERATSGDVDFQHRAGFLSITASNAYRFSEHAELKADPTCDAR